VRTLLCVVGISSFAVGACTTSLRSSSQDLNSAAIANIIMQGMHEADLSSLSRNADVRQRGCRPTSSDWGNATCVDR
jgi:hypothetical protein